MPTVRPGSRPRGGVLPSPGAGLLVSQALAHREQADIGTALRVNDQGCPWWPCLTWGLWLSQCCSGSFQVTT